MGGEFGTIEGPTKLATWKEFRKYLKERELSTKEEQRAAGMHLIFPRTKRGAYGSMKRNNDDSGWVLEFHLHS